MKISDASIVALLFVFFMGTSDAHALSDEPFGDYQDLILALRDDNRTPRFAERISVNRNDTIRLIFPNKCEAEGEAELQRLSMRAEVEEAYVFIPHLCLWIEAGHGEKQDAVSLDLNFTKTLLEYASSLIFYHIQPGDKSRIESYFPSYKDFLTMTLISADMVWKPGRQIRHRMVSQYGVMEYDFSNLDRVQYFMNKFRGDGLRGSESQNLAYEYLRPTYRSDYYKKIKKFELNYALTVQTFEQCCPIQTQAFIVHFRPITVATKKISISN